MADKSTLLWGYHPVAETIRARRRRVYTLYVTKDSHHRRMSSWIAAAENSGATVRMTDHQQLTALVGHGRHQGVAAAVSAYPYSSLDAVLEAAAQEGVAPFVLVLDRIVDPQNLGAIARTAHCAGVQGIILPKRHSAPPSPAASKASAGALEHMRLAYVTNAVRALKHLKSQGLWIAAADQQAAQTVFDADLTGPLALVIGGEQKGIRSLVKQHCDFSLSIPQTGKVSSLNASAASAVVLYEAFRQRRG